jgi:ADP-glucose pyrophosphorylase
MLQPYIKRGRIAEWYAGPPTRCSRTGTSSSAGGDTILVLAGDHIYKMDYQPFLAAHRRSGRT